MCVERDIVFDDGMNFQVVPVVSASVWKVQSTKATYLDAGYYHGGSIVFTTPHELSARSRLNCTLARD